MKECEVGSGVSAQRRFLMNRSFDDCFVVDDVHLGLVFRLRSVRRGIGLRGSGYCAISQTQQAYDSK